MPNDRPHSIDYTSFSETGGFIEHNGPYYWAREPSGDWIYGFQSDARHGNPNGVLHGAAVTAFVDTFLGHAVVARTGRLCATVALNVQFVAGAPAGGWISGRARLRKLTRSHGLSRRRGECRGDAAADRHRHLSGVRCSRQPARERTRDVRLAAASTSAGTSQPERWRFGTLMSAVFWKLSAISQPAARATNANDG